MSAGNNTTWQVNSDGQLTLIATPNGHRRVARFRFFGHDVDANLYGWTRCQYRYGVGGGANFGPQSNEVVEFRREQDPPRSGQLWGTYNSPDNHNSNVPGSAPVQHMDRVYTSPAGDSEIWVRAIFDVPNDPDPSCWTNAVALK